jgi:hypothetical protein
LKSGGIYSFLFGGLPGTYPKNIFSNPSLERFYSLKCRASRYHCIGLWRYFVLSLPREKNQETGTMNHDIKKGQRYLGKYICPDSWLMTLRSLNTQYALPTTHSAQAGETGNVQSGGTERRTYIVEHATLH